MDLAELVATSCVVGLVEAQILALRWLEFKGLGRSGSRALRCDGRPRISKIDLSTICRAVDVPLDPPECFQGELSQLELVRLALRSELLHDRRDTIRRLNRQLRTDALG